MDSWLCFQAEHRSNRKLFRSQLRSYLCGEYLILSLSSPDPVKDHAMSTTNSSQPGERSRAICGRCNSIQETTLERRDVPLDDGSGTAQNALAAICTNCGDVVAMPAQELNIVPLS